MSLSSVALPRPPENHRQIQYALDAGRRFPFTPGTFTVVVLRFPAACSEALYRHLVSEAKRVLKPSGYLEMTVLDFDMSSMGPKTRRAVRGLKTGVLVREPEISLASASETLMRMVGKFRFSDVKSCRVGVPVASAVTSSTTGTAAGTPSVEAERQLGGPAARELKRELSLAELMKDNSAKADAGIGMMVAKVGRWWYNRCYEGGDAQGSVWADEKVVEECERWGTSFRLVVAYAQRPVVPRRRTASV
jgi:hypothetical protein